MANEVDGYLEPSMTLEMAEHSLKLVLLNIPLKWAKRKAYASIPYFMLIWCRLPLMLFNFRLTRKEIFSMTPLFDKVTTVIELFIHPSKTSYLFVNEPM
jgi:hypothetical protein